MPSRSGRSSRSKSSSRSASSRSKTSSRGSRRGSTRSTSSSRSKSAGSRSASATSRSRATSARSSRSATSARSSRNPSSRGASSKSKASSRPLTDHEEIRRWAEERDASPACVRGTGGSEDIGMIRLDFPGYSGGDSLERIEWDEWFQKFDERRLALLVQEKTARGERSNFNKLVSRETAGSGGRGRSGKKSASGSRGGGSKRRAA